MTEYPFEIRPLGTEEGGGFLITYPDFDMCVSDGETIEEAIANGQHALEATVAALVAAGLPVPQPNSYLGKASGKFVVRVPKTLHARLASRSRREGVSLNTLVVSYLAAGMEHEVPY
ncbi:MAG TPA: toxin-antitoxin system HicB family antitoxin [Fluviicoccus sp.]|nr:toxin-antitoxin system HicB family antitoxin [Fluviicoccus sp.]